MTVTGNRVDGRSGRFLRMAIGALALSAAIGIWQWGQLPEASAGAPVDQKVLPPTGAPAASQMSSKP